MAKLRILVSTENTKFVGQAWLPVDQIRPGYRFITLKNESSQSLMMPSMLIYFEIDDYVPCDMEDFALALSNPIAFLSEKERRAQQLEILTEDFMEANEREEESDGEPHEKSKTTLKLSNEKNLNLKTPLNESPSETLISKKKKQTTRLKESFKKKSSLKRGKSTRGIFENEEIVEFINQSILKDETLSKIDLEKMKAYKVCSKINEKKESLIISITKKYDKKKSLLLSKIDSKDEGAKEKKDSKMSVKYKNKSNSSSMDESATEHFDYTVNEDIQEKLSQIDSKSKEILSNINVNQANEIKAINVKYINLFYEELYASMESDISRFQKRIDKIYRKECEVLKSLQHYKFKCETKFLQRECSNKDEFNRLKREALQKYIQCSVSELQKLTDLKNMRAKDLENHIIIASEKFKNDKEKDFKLFC